MMDDFDLEDNNYRPLEEVLKGYENILKGDYSIFLEEEDYITLVEYFDEEEQTLKAIEAINIGLQFFPYSSVLLIKKADFEIADNKFRQALHTLEQSEAYNRKDINLYILKIDAYLGLNMPEEANETYMQAIDMFEGEELIDLLLELSDLFDDYDDFERVFETLKQVLKFDPQNKEALYKFCFWAEFLGKNEDSIRIHEKIINQYPYNEIAWFNLAVAYQGLKLYEKAIDCYQYAIAINDKFDYAYRNIGDAYIRIRKYKEAIDALEKISAYSFEEDIVHNAIAYCHHKLGNFAKARHHYNIALQTNPNDANIAYKIALTYMSEEQWHKAEKAIEGVILSKKNIPELHFAMGECRFQQGAYMEAIEHFGIALKSKPKNIGLWEALIRSLYFCNDFEEAIEQCENAFELTEGKYIFLFYKAFALFEMKKHKEGSFFLEIALQNDPKSFKKVIDINPDLMQSNIIVELLARYPIKKRPKTER